MIQWTRVALLILGSVAGGAALAHTGEHAGGGWAAGFAHPFMGLDHLLAMVAVGAWAVQRGARARFGLPAAFLAAMALGAAAGALGLALPHVEAVIALSVLALGGFVACNPQTRRHVPYAVVMLFALFHGHAHGAEMPAFAATWTYFAGFAAATAALHAAGAVSALLLEARPALLRAGGAGMGLAGSWLLLMAIA